MYFYIFINYHKIKFTNKMDKYLLIRCYLPNVALFGLPLTAAAGACSVIEE